MGEINTTVCRDCGEIIVEDVDGVWRTLMGERCIGDQLHDA